MKDDFEGNELNTNYWIPAYLPQWSSREKTIPSYRIQDSILTLYISDAQEPWCPEWNGSVRVSNLQTGVFSGEIGSRAGQHHFTEGLVVREFQQKDFKVTPQYGKKIKVINQSPDYPMQIMLNLYDLENIKNENNVFEIDYVKVEAM